MNNKNDNDLSQWIKEQTVPYLYRFLTQGQDIPECILKEYGMTEDYAMYKRIENMEYEVYDADRKNGRLPDIIALNARLTRKIEAAMESCGGPPRVYLEKLNDELEELGRIARNPEYADRIYLFPDFFAKYGIDKDSPAEVVARQAENAYRELDARFVKMTGRKPYADIVLGPAKQTQDITADTKSSVDVRKSKGRGIRF